MYSIGVNFTEIYFRNFVNEPCSIPENSIADVWLDTTVYLSIMYYIGNGPFAK